MTTTVMQTLVVPWLTAFALALAPILGGVALELLRRHGVQTQWIEAIGRAGGAGISAAVASGRPLTDRATLVAAAQAGAAYLQDRVPGIVASKGLDPAALAQIAGAEIGKLMALDPTVPTGAATVTAVAGPGQVAQATVMPDPVHLVEASA